jgi:glucan 1,3-beta-glucosidase
MVCGEWTAAMTDCATFVNGYGVGARYDGTFPGSTYVGSCDNLNAISSWSSDQRSGTTQYIQAQIQAFESYVQGWIFWNFKTESAGEWNLFGLIDAGIWPGV